jgi:CBS domain containing-hemolysin-like protein
MNDTEPPSSSAEPQAKRLGLFSWLKTVLALRTVSLRDDLEVALHDIASAETADFSANERTILQNVLKLGDLSVDDVVVPRADIVAVDADQTIAQLIDHFRRAGHSRLPVFREDLDHIVGFIHIKDVLSAITTQSAGPARAELPVRLLTPVLRQKIDRLDLIREVMFVPPSMPVGDLLQQMQKTRVHMAIVIDEYGGTDGLVTIEDLLESVVGEIDDEYDVAGPVLIKKIDDDTFMADARIELDELPAHLGPDFDPGDAADEVDTLGGLVTELVDRVPVRGEIVRGFRGFDFEILQADTRRVKKVRILRRKAQAVAATGAEEEQAAE